jgi:hypothetical protein
MLYLAPIVGAGTFADRFRPRGVDGMRAWGMLDLRAGGGSSLCLVWTPDASPILGEGTRVTQLLANEDEALTRQLGLKLETELGVNLADANNGVGLMQQLFFGRQETRWPSVKPNQRGLKRVLIAGREWASESAAVSRQLGIDPTDDFNRANETPLASPWTVATGSTNNLNLSSNAITASGVGTKFNYYSGATATADQFSKIVQISAITDNDWGPAVRIGSDGAFSGYFFNQNTASPTAEGLWRKNASGYTQILASAITNVANGDEVEIRCEVNDITGLRNGSTLSGPHTDSAPMTAEGDGVGLFVYQTGGSLDDWQGGDYSAPTTVAGGIIGGGVGSDAFVIGA